MKSLLRIKFLLSIFGFILLSISLSSIAFGASISDDSLPTGAYYFSSDGVLSGASGDQAGMFDQILKGKQNSIIDEMQKMAQGGFTDKSVSGDLETDSGTNMWNSDMNAFYNNTSGTTIKMRQGSVVYNIYVPKGKAPRTDAKGNVYYADVNQDIIGATISAVAKYQFAVKEGILTGSLENSYNIYSMYPDKKQVPVTDILENAVDAKGNPVAYKAFKSSGVDMVYSLDYFYNPLFGKMNGADVKGDKSFWDAKIPDVKITVGSGGKIAVVIDDKFLNFIQPDSTDRETLSSVDSATVTKADGVKSYSATTTGRKVEPKDFVDGAMRLMVPTQFASMDNGNYVLAQDQSFTVLPNTKLLISHSYVYLKDGDTFKRKGDYATYGIDDQSLVLYNIAIDKDGKAVKTDKNGTLPTGARRVGAVIPLWYKEAIIDTTKNGTIYPTGRTVKFGNDYSGKITLDGLNKDLVSIEDKTSGASGIQLRKFAFGPTADHTAKEDHYSVDTAPKQFKLEITFESIENGVKGFVIFRNNWYVDDPDLMRWLESSEAKAMTEVKADELYKSISGGFTMTKQPMSYDKWVRLKQIQGELDISFKSKALSFIRIITIVFGVFMIFYSILLVMAYWLDIFNVMMEFSFLNRMTFSKLYPITSEEDLSYVTYKKGNVKYVTFWHVIVICLVGMSVGIVFIFCSPIIDFLLYVYYQITSWVGVV